MSTFKILIAILLFSTQPCFGVDTDEYHRTMAKHYFEEKNYPEAKKSIDQVLNAAPDDKEFQSLRTQVVAQMARLKASREAEEKKKKAQALKAAEIKDAEQRAKLLQSAKAREEQNQKEAREAPAKRAAFLNSVICDCEALRKLAESNLEREKRVGEIGGFVNKEKIYGMSNTIEASDRAIEQAKQELSTSGAAATQCPPPQSIPGGLGNTCARFRIERSRPK